MKLQDALANIRPWNDLPPSLRPWGDTVRLSSFADNLETRRPKRIEAVLATPTNLKRRQTWTPQLWTVAHFESAYVIIERVAGVIAPTAHASGVLPMIVPVQAKLFEELSENDKLVQRLFDVGAIVYRET